MSIRDLKRTNIKAYAEGAIKCLQEQLPSARTVNKQAKLSNRINHWKRVLNSDALKNFRQGDDPKLITFDEVSK